MAEFNSWQDYRKFAYSVMRQARYVFPKEVDEFLNNVLKTSQGRSKTLKEGSNLWRAQHGYRWRTLKQDSFTFEVPVPYPADRMKPLNHSALEGRVNPKGIPCLYLATDKETAMSEVRPWHGSFISVGQFKIQEDLKVVDCSTEQHDGSLSYLDEPEPSERERAVWGDIGWAFSKPVDRGESIAEYAPTQVLAEAFRSHGFSGILYKSLTGKGANVVLFNIKSADLFNCFLFEVESVSFQFKNLCEAYFIKKYYKRDEASNG